MNKTKMENPVVCLITGPAGAGKSSVAKMLAEKFERSAVVNVDNLRNSIIGGRVRPWPHSEEAKTQLSLSVKNACLLASNFLDSGFNVIIDDVIGTNLFKQYSEFFYGKSLKTFLLLPSLESLLKRFDQRGVSDELRKRTHELHEEFNQRKNKVDWQVIDSSNQTLEETTEEVFNILIK